MGVLGQVRAEARDQLLLLAVAPICLRTTPKHKMIVLILPRLPSNLGLKRVPFFA